MSTTALRSMATGSAIEPKKPANFPSMLEAYKGEIARALPKHLNADTMTRIALTCFRMNPKLGECQPASVFASVIQASQLGLRPGLMGECYLIPYKTRDGMQCQLQIGYQGLLELVRRSGLVESVGAYLVRDRDTYNVKFGTDPGIEHIPYLDGDPGAVRFGYAVARLKGGGTHIEVMSLTEIERIKERSQNVQNARRYNKDTPWDTDFDEMARKTLIRRICKYLPKSPDLAMALALDSSMGQQNITVDDAIAGTFVPPIIDADTGDAASPQQISAVQSGPTAANQADPDTGETTPPKKTDLDLAFDPALMEKRVNECTDLQVLSMLVDDINTMPEKDPARAALLAAVTAREKFLTTEQPKGK